MFKCGLQWLYNAVKHSVLLCQVLGQITSNACSAHRLTCAMFVLPELDILHARRAQAESADAMQRFRAQSSRLMGDAKEQGDIEFGGEVLLESKVRSRMLLIGPLRKERAVGDVHRALDMRCDLQPALKLVGRKRFCRNPLFHLWQAEMWAAATWHS